MGADHHSPTVAGAHAPDLDLAEYVALLRRDRLQILAAVAGALLLGGLYLLLVPPRFEADALVQVEKRTPSGMNLVSLPDLLQTGSEVATEIEIIRSRSVLGAVVDELRLDIEAEPLHLPLIGAALARRNEAGEEGARFGLGYAWGGERIGIADLEVPDFLLERELRLVAAGNDRYLLTDHEGVALLEGSVGATVEAPVEDRGEAWRAGHLRIRVERLQARPGTPFRLIRHSRARTLSQLQRDLQVVEQGRETGILRITLSGEEPARITTIVDSITTHYLRQNAERLSAEAQHMLEFAKAQLPALRANVDAAERALNDYRAAKGTVDVSLEIQGMLDTMAALEKSISELELERAELRQRFTGEHPRLVALQEKIGRLEEDRDRLNRKLKAVPATEWDTVRLMRDVKVSSELYVLLLNRAQELGVAKAGTIGNARLLDAAALPEEPVSPRAAAVLAQALLAGLLLGAFRAVARRIFMRTVEDPGEIERAVRLPVHAAVLHSRHQRRLAESRRGGERILASAHPDDPAVESLRSLRTTLQLALAGASSRIVCITGPVAAVGKSFVAVNLAAVLAMGGRRTLLIDADMRRGELHLPLGIARTPGLSEMLSGKSEGWAPQATSHGFHLLPSGEQPANPSELLLSERLAALLKQAQRDFDVVIVDTPPLLPVTDAGIIGRLAGVSLIVLRAGAHRLDDIALTLQRAKQMGVTVDGLVVNDLYRGVPADRYTAHYHSYYVSTRRDTAPRPLRLARAFARRLFGRGGVGKARPVPGGARGSDG